MDAGACSALASAYDQSCSTDSDCVAVPLGTNVCGIPCSEEEVGYLVCPNSAVNLSAQAAYTAAVAATLGTYSSACNVDASSLVFNCPAEFTPTCVHGVCTQAPPATASGDAGSPALSCAGITSFDFASTTSIPANPPPAVNVAVTSAATAQAACATTLAQPTFPPGVFNCPNDFGVTYQLTFHDASGGVAFIASADPGGCESIGLSGGAATLQASAAFWSAIAGDIRVAELTIYPYLPPDQ